MLLRRPRGVRGRGYAAQVARPLDVNRYEELEPRLRTGDILLFHGDSRRSRVIEGVTRSKFSHVGMIVRPDPAKAPLLWR